MSGDEQLLRKMYAAWNEGGVVAAAQFWAEDIVIHDFPELPDATVTHGREQATQVWEERIKTFDIHLDVTSIEEIGPGRFFVTLAVRTKGPATGISLDETHFHIATIRDGQFTEGRFFRNRAQAREAAGLPPE
jgi:ketosteroid isomerase-like protein